MMMICKAAMAWKVVSCLRHKQSLLIPVLARTSTLQSLIFASRLRSVSIELDHFTQAQASYLNSLC